MTELEFDFTDLDKMIDPKKYDVEGYKKKLIDRTAYITDPVKRVKAVNGCAYYTALTLWEDYGWDTDSDSTVHNDSGSTEDYICIHESESDDLTTSEVP